MKHSVLDERTEEIIEIKSYMYPAFHVENESNESSRDTDPKSSHQQVDMLSGNASSSKRDSKGVVFFIHGFSDYAGRYAHLGKVFSRLGYDFFCMD